MRIVYRENVLKLGKIYGMICMYIYVSNNNLINIMSILASQLYIMLQRDDSYVNVEVIMLIRSSFGCYVRSSYVYSSKQEMVVVISKQLKLQKNMFLLGYTQYVEQKHENGQWKQKREESEGQCVKLSCVIINYYFIQLDFFYL